MQIRDITPTFPPSALIVVRTDNGLVEIEIDNRGDQVRVTLNAHKAAVLMVAVSQALAMIAREKETQP